MVSSNPIMRVYLDRGRIILTRTTIRQLGNPSHLSFWYDEAKGTLIISPAAKEDLDAFEIPQYFWRDTNQSCEIARHAFLKALQYRLAWEEGSWHVFEGSSIKTGSTPAAVFSLVNGTRLK